MAANTLSTFAGALKEVTAQDGINDTLNNSNVLFAQLEAGNKKKFEFGKYGIMSLLTARGGIASFVDPGTMTLPTGAANSPQQAQVYAKYVLGNASITDSLLTQAMTNEATFKDALQTAKDGAIMTIKKTLTSSFYSNQKGFLSGFSTTTVSGTSGARIFTVDNVNAFFVGQLIDCVTSAGVDITNGTDLTISKVDKKNNQITTDATTSPTLVSGAKVVNANSYNLAIAGLDYNLNDTDGDETDWFGITRSSYPTINIDFFGGSSTTSKETLTELMLMEACDYPEEIGSGGAPDISLWDYDLLRYYTEVLAKNKIFNSTTLNGGYEAITFNNRGKKLSLVPDTHCTKGYIYILNSKSWKLFQSSGLDYLNVNSAGDIMRLNSTYANYEFYPKYYANLGTVNPRMNSVIRHVQPAA